MSIMLDVGSNICRRYWMLVRIYVDSTGYRVEYMSIVLDQVEYMSIAIDQVEYMSYHRMLGRICSIYHDYRNSTRAEDGVLKNAPRAICRLRGRQTEERRGEIPRSPSWCGVCLLTMYINFPGRCERVPSAIYAGAGSLFEPSRGVAHTGLLLLL
jgi:hypothetical protein